MRFFAASEAEGKLKDAVNNLPNSGGFDQSNVTNILNTAYAFAGTVAVAFIVYGGIQYLTANGDAGKITKAKNTIVYAVVGLLIVILAAAITYFVTQGIMGAGVEE